MSDYLAGKVVIGRKYIKKILTAKDVKHLQLVSTISQPEKGQKASVFWTLYTKREDPTGIVVYKK